MTAFADASAIVRLYADEPGHDLIAGSDHLVVSDVSRVEVVAALWRKHRTGELSPGQARLLVDAFLADWSGGDRPTYLPIAPTTTVLDTAVALCGVHGLRAYDSVQLASAVAGRSADSEITGFLAFDTALVQAAAAEGFIVNEA